MSRMIPEEAIADLQMVDAATKAKCKAFKALRAMLNEEQRPALIDLEEAMFSESRARYHLAMTLRRAGSKRHQIDRLAFDG